MNTPKTQEVRKAFQNAIRAACAPQDDDVADFSNLESSLSNAAWHNHSNGIQTLAVGDKLLLLRGIQLFVIDDIGDNQLDQIKSEIDDMENALRRAIPDGAVVSAACHFVDGVRIPGGRQIPCGFHAIVRAK